MAIVKKIGEDEDKEQGMNVLGQDQGMQQSQQDDQSASQGAVSVSGGPSATIQGGSSAQPQQASQKAAGDKKGSGMFTNLRKYVSANKPQAAKIAGAVTKDFGQQAKQVQQGLQKKQQSFQERVAEQRARQDQAGTFAQSTLQAAGTQGQAPTAEDTQKFQKLLSGEQNFSNVGQLSTAPQQVEAQKLARQAALSERASGASNLLRSTFGDQNQYTRGQQSLDSLILGGDQQARNKLVQDVQGTAEGLTGELRDARQQALAQSGELQRSGQTFREDLQNQLTGAREGVVSDIDAEVERQRQALVDKQAQFQEALNSGTLTPELAREFIDQQALDQAAQEAKRQMELERATLLGSGLGLSGGAQNAATTELRNMFGSGQEGYNKFVEARKDIFSGTDNDLYLADQIGGQALDLNNLAYSLFNKGIGAAEGSAHNSNRRVLDLNPVLDVLAKRGMSQSDLQKVLVDRGVALQDYDREYGYDDSGIKRYGREKGSELTPGAGEILKDYISEQYKSMNPTGEQYLQDFLNLQGQQQRRDLGDFLSATDTQSIGRENVVTDEQLARQKALATLAGREGEGIVERGEAVTTPGRFNLLDAMKKLGYQF